MLKSRIPYWHSDLAHELSGRPGSEFAVRAQHAPDGMMNGGCKPFKFVRRRSGPWRDVALPYQKAAARQDRSTRSIVQSWHRFGRDHHGFFEGA
jgi:hypothetical protein